MQRIKSVLAYLESRWGLYLLLLSLSPLGAQNLNLEMGLNRIWNHEADNAYSTALDYSPARAYIGLNSSYNLSSKLALGGKLIYHHRQHGNPDADLQLRGAYLDLGLHPLVRLPGFYAYAGPSLGFRIASSSRGEAPWYSDEREENLAELVPGFQAGIRFPADNSSNMSFELSYNRDLSPFFEYGGRKLEQEQVNLGFNIRLKKQDPQLHLIWDSLRKVKDESRMSMGFALSTKKEDFITEFSSIYEQIYWIGPLGLGGAINQSFGTILPEDGFAVWFKMLAGPQFSLKLGQFEPYVRTGWGVLPLLAFEDKDKTGLYVVDSQEAGTKIHFSDELALDLRYQNQNYYNQNRVETYGLGISIKVD